MSKPKQEHLKFCECEDCVQRRFHEAAEGLEAFVKKTGAAPRSADQLVRVKEYTVSAHLRRNRRYMNHDPKVRKLLEAFVRALAKGRQR